MVDVRTVVLAGVLAVATSARAQPAVGDADAAYREGRRLYDLHDWDLAIARFKEAYRLRPDAASLFDIAQAYRLKGDCVEAQSFYKTYRRNFPTAANVAKVDKFIADLDACAKAAAAKTAPPPPIVTDPVPPPPDPRIQTAPEPRTDPPPTFTTPIDTRPSPIQTTPIVDDPNAGRTQRIAGLAVAGAGVVAVAAGVVFGLQAASKSSDVAAGHGVWNPSLESDGQSAETRAESLWAIGGAAIVVGGVLYYFGRHDTPHVAVQPRAGGAMMVWSCGL